MTKTTDSALDRFRILEERIAGALDALRAARQENDAAARELGKARSRIGHLEEEIAELRRERAEVRDRVEALISSLAALDRSKEESIA